ncbi:ABC transporter substrate-binding protein [Acidisphaera sp. S103]|uniref:ABC transporter substrate-binding protein n=1 Tax=Acidisphaera sp. S103 TaxID=1747223 RepID=UPI00131E7F44|nr:ABC transporter substrate-binding protein [Acidisphaera sp. S103]
MLNRRSLGLALLASPFVSRRVRAEDSIVRISKQYGLGYMSMMVMEHEHLVERHAAKVGLPNLRTEWSVLGGPGPQIDALLAGQVGFIGPGSTTLATLWDKTAGTGRDIKALSALQSMPFVLMTRNPAVHSITDLTEHDKIALPGVKITGHALTLEMAAANQWGFSAYDRLDSLTVTLAHPDAMAELLGGRSEIDCHLASSPFYYYEQAAPGVHRVFKSYDITGGMHTNGVMLTSKAYHDSNPKVCAAVLAAQQEANDFIRSNPRPTAQIYLELTGDKHASVEQMAGWVADPDVVYTTVPMKVMDFAVFMHKVGRLKRQPDSWKDMFFEESQDVEGS